MKEGNTKINIFIEELFYISTLAVVVFVIFEVMWPRVFLAYINFGLVLIFWLITGIMLLTVNKNKDLNE